mgnify:CR=1 FL=1
MFVHLHVHSCYSFLKGLASPAELAQTAARLEMPALALTDHQGMSGAIEFYSACRERGVQPVLGLELDVKTPLEISAYSGANQGVLTLLALNLEGWSSLCRLSSCAHAEAGGPRSVAFETLAEHNQGLICLSGGRAGLFNGFVLLGQEKAASTGLERLREIFPERLYVELQLHSATDRECTASLYRLAKKFGLPVVATHDIYYLYPEQADLQRTISAIRLNRPIATLEENDFAPANAHFLTSAEMISRFEAYPEAVASSQEIAQRCTLELPLGRPQFPNIDLPPGLTPIQVLRHRAKEGARRLYAPTEDQIQGRTIPDEIQRRLDHELEVIESCGYEALFLVMEQIVSFARQQGIPIASRGSASSSLVAHCLGITTPDPVRLNLYFERFLNPARASLPDIDTDLCSRRRDEVIEFVYRHFGAERAAMVCTISRFRRRSALRETAKAHGLSPTEVKALAERMPERWYGPPDRYNADQAPYAELAEHFSSPRYQTIFQHAAALIGLPRHLSIHPGGVVIAPRPITDLAPTQLASKGVIITQFDLDSIEQLGLVKIDLLGIRGLTVLGDVAQAVQDDPSVAQTIHAPAASFVPKHGALPFLHGERRATNALSFLDAIPQEDPETSTLVEQGRTIGCFQIESPGMRATLREIRARTMEDILAALALYRPGPLTGGLKEAFVARYRGLESPTYLHPSLEPLLCDTYGVILYQEQVLRIAHELAGFSLADSDLLRRAMSHFDPGKQMQALKERFLAGALQRSGIPTAIAEHIWELMAAFAGYGFPKAHAASYARVAWQSAWCKTHFPALFMASVLANWGGYYSQSIYLTEARRLGLIVQPPHVNFSSREFSVRQVDGQATLFMGLNQVRELTRRTQERILRYRPFTSLQDFLARADPRPQEAENLARVGALSGMGSIPGLLRQIQRGGWRGGQLALFEVAVPPDEDWTLGQRAIAEQSVLGVSVSVHPLELHAARLQTAGALNTLEAAAQIGKRVRVAGARQSWRRSRTQRGDYIYFMILEDLEGMLEVIIPSDVYARSRTALRAAGPYIIEGQMEFNAERGEPYIRAEQVFNLTLET